VRSVAPFQPEHLAEERERHAVHRVPREGANPSAALSDDPVALPRRAACVTEHPPLWKIPIEVRHDGAVEGQPVEAKRMPLTIVVVPAADAAVLRGACFDPVEGGSVKDHRLALFVRVCQSVLSGGLLFNCWIAASIARRAALTSLTAFVRRPPACSAASRASSYSSRAFK